MKANNLNNKIEIINNEIKINMSLFGGSLAGTKWTLKLQAGAMKVGPAQGSGNWWSSSITDVTNRDFANDFFEFYSDGSFINNLGYRTFLESWQHSGGDTLGTPIFPHDGSVKHSWSVDSSNNLTLSGTGAYLGLPKVINSSEISDNNDAPNSRTYIIQTLSTSELILDINAGSIWWRFEFNYVEDLPTSPQVPDPVTYATISGGIREATINWTGDFSNTGYSISIKDDSTSKVDLPRDIINTSRYGEYTFTGLDNGTSYTFVIKAKNAAGESRGVETDVVTTSSLPSPPSTLIATKKLNSVLLEWTGNSTDTGYVISINGQSGSDVTLGIVSEYTYTGLTAGETYKFVIKAIDAVGTGTYTTTSNEVTLPVISTVSNVVLSINLNTVKITFDSTEDDEFKNTYSVTSNIGSLSYTPTGKEITITDAASNGFSYGRYYDFNVVATNDVGSSTSVKSNTVKFNYKSTNYKDDKSHSVTKKAAINQLGFDGNYGDCSKFDKTGKYIYIAYRSQDGNPANTLQIHLEKRDLNFNLLYKYELAYDLNNEALLGMCIKNDSIYLTGYLQYPGGLLMLKINDNGTSFTQEIFKNINDSPAGTSWYASSYDIQLDSSNNIYIYGFVDGQIGYDPPDRGYDLFLIKFDSNGVEKWRKQFSANKSSYDYPYPNNLFIQNDRIFCGYRGVNESFTQWAIRVFELDIDGNIIKNYEYDTPSYQGQYDLCLDENFNIYTTSYDGVTGKYICYKFEMNETTSKLELIWSKDFGVTWLNHINIQNNQLITSNSQYIRLLELDGTITKEIKLDDFITNITTGTVYSSLYSVENKSHFIFGRSNSSIAAENPDSDTDFFMLKIEESTYVDNLTINENKTLSIKLD